MSTHGYEEFWKDLKRGPVAPAYYFFGEVDVLKDEAIASLLDQVLPAALRDFNLDRRSAGQLDPRDIQTLCTTLPMMAERRVVLIGEVEAWGKKARAKAAMLQYLDRPAAETVLILVQGTSTPEGDSELIARTYAVQFKALRQDHAERWMKRQANRLGVALAPDAAAHLLLATEGELGLLAAELAKLSGLAGSEPVTVAQVEALLGVRHGETQFDWRDAILGDRPDRAAAMLPHVLDQPGISGVRLVTLIGTDLVGLGVARAFYERGARDSSLESAVFGAVRNARLAGRDWKATAAAWARAVPGWPPARIRAGVRAALAADLALKSTTISEDRGILTDLIIALAPARREAA